MPSSAVQTCALRSEEHTSELQSHDNLVCRLLLEKHTPPHSRHRPPTTRPPPRPRPNLHHPRVLGAAAQPSASGGQGTGPRGTIFFSFFLTPRPPPSPPPFPEAALSAS